MSQNSKVLNEAFKSWSPIAATIIILCLTAYGLVQQNYRMSANDPQIQGLEDIIDQINQGRPADSMLPPTGTTEISNSLAPFAMMFNESGKLIGSTAILNGKNPDFPLSVLQNAKKSDKQSRVTWQPQAGVRQAVVIAHYQTKDGKTSGYALVGRSLREVEIRENQALMIAGFGALLGLIITFLIVWLVKKTEMPKPETTTATETITIIEEKKV